MSNIEAMIPVSIRDDATMTSQLILFEPDGENLSIVEKIGFSKIRLLNAISNYLDGALAGLSKMANLTAFPTLRFDVLQKEVIRRFKEYEKELRSFSIKSFDCVVFNRQEYSKQEPVRRLTQIHLEILQEFRANGIYVGKVQDEYEELLKEFIEMVR